MVSDAILSAFLGGLLALSGALIGLFAEPVRNFFARRARQEHLRRTLYGELFIKLQRAAANLDSYRLAIERQDIDYLKLHKVDLSEPISFPDEVTAQEQYYQLTTQERNALAVAYYNLRSFINGVTIFGSTPLDTKEAMELYPKLKEMLQSAIFYVNLAFENNARILEKIDEGAILKDWRELIQDRTLQKEYLSDPAKKALKVAAEKKKKRLLRH